jgi:peptidoglycan/LPS O-acetylase OafA/YrhL
MSQNRNASLDGLRGLAALCVAIGHCATNVGGMSPYLLSVHDLTTASWRDTGFRLIHVFINADAAVVLFFVLSGYVLTLSLANAQFRFASLSAYVIRRAFRLLPAAIVSAVLIGVVINASWTDILGAAFLLDYKINGPIWSLQVEVIGSALVFLLAVLTAQWRWSPLAALAVTVSAACYYPHYLVLFLPAFVLGALIRDTRPLFRGSLLVAGLLALLLADYVIGRGLAARLTQMIGAFFIVGYVATHSARVLSSSPVKFLGDISYPFYLMHFLSIILIERFITLAGTKSFTAWLGLSIAVVVLTALMSMIIRRFVEIPGIRMGSRSISLASLRLNSSSPEFPR